MANSVRNPMAALPPRPEVSQKTIPMAGLLVDVYGLKELKPSVTQVSCLWLHHGRTRSKTDMVDIAPRCVAAWNGHSRSQDRGLIALAFDARNHGTRLVNEKANSAWPMNDTHAQDMLYGIFGTVEDQRELLDAVHAYLFLEDEPDVGAKAGTPITQHLMLGVSLGGHLVWETMFVEDRITASIVIVGCPDVVGLLTDRARNTKVPTFRTEDNGASFLGSKHFPPSLLADCKKRDPKTAIFGTGPVHAATSGDSAHSNDQETRSRLLGRKYLLCYGADDQLVPHRMSQPFVEWFKGFIKESTSSSPTWLEEVVYPKTGHEFSPGMVAKSVKFVCDVLGGNVDERLQSGSVAFSSTGENLTAGKL